MVVGIELLDLWVATQNVCNLDRHQLLPTSLVLRLHLRQR